MENSVQDDSSMILFSPIFQVSIIFRHLFSICSAKVPGLGRRGSKVFHRFPRRGGISN